MELKWVVLLGLGVGLERGGEGARGMLGPRLTLDECMTCSPTYTLRKLWKKVSRASSSRCRERSP